MLRVKEVCKVYNGVVVLKGISIELKEGEVLGIVGPNGSGKSTLLRIISGFEKPNCGRVYFYDKEIMGLKPEEIVRLGIAYTFQIPRPFKNLTVLENIAVASLLRFNRRKAFEIAREICDLFKLNGNEIASNLSQGNLKILEIARALATQPKLLLLDEPFSGLDVENTKTVLNKVIKLKEMGYSMIITAHRVKILEKIADRFLELRGGKVVRS